MNIFLKAYTIKSVLSVHAPLYFTFLVFLVEEKTILKIVLASMKLFTNFKMCTKSRIRISIWLPDSDFLQCSLDG
jgi:hypothetical protein